MVMVGEMVMVWVVVGKERMEERRMGMEGMGKGHKQCDARVLEVDESCLRKNWGKVELGEVYW